MYSNLQKVLSSRKISNKDLARFLNVDEKTVQNRMSGKYEWTLAEASKIIEIYLSL